MKNVKIEWNNDVCFRKIEVRPFASGLLVFKKDPYPVIINYSPFADGIIFNTSNNTFGDISIDGAPPASLKGSVKSISGKFVIWNMANAANTAINKGFLYTPDLNGFGKPQKLRLYLYQKN